jgi:hypothetical protein
VREKMVEFLQKNYPESLPKVRAEVGPPAQDKTSQETAEQQGASSGPPKEEEN